MDDEGLTALLDVANTSVDRIIEKIRDLSASGRLVTVEDVMMLLRALNLGDDAERHRDTLAVLLAVTLQRLAWR